MNFSDFGMDVWIKYILAVGGLVIAVCVIRYVIRTVFNKAEDAIQNKIAEKKNAQSEGREENLSDRYK